MDDKEGLYEHGNNIVSIWMAASLPRKRSVGEIYVFLTNKSCVNMQLSKNFPHRQQRKHEPIFVFTNYVEGYEAAITSYDKNASQL